jgi:CDP-glucose 4,6-dehydratase
MGVTRSFWEGRRVFLTGHTGFKGAWLSLWLRRLGAVVTGYSLEPEPGPSLYALADAARDVQSIFADIRDVDALRGAVSAARPEIVFHLAAQSIVRESYRSPLDTISTNVLGTANVLEALRHVDTARTVVIVTSDKCYENREQRIAYRETDPMGGRDPYSASKGAAEIITAAYRRSFFCEAGSAGVATARAGNVIGGGDFATDRLIPDCVRAATSKEPVLLRNPESTRPWQFVLEPLSGYLALAERLHTDGHAYAEGWNFGPDDREARTVQWLCESFANALGKAGNRVVIESDRAAHQPHEAAILALDSSKARSRLDWHPVLSLDEMLEMTASWYVAYLQKDDLRACALSQIAAFESRFTPIH